jgi:hypothetical protein
MKENGYAETTIEAIGKMLRLFNGSIWPIEFVLFIRLSQKASNG